MQKKTNRPIKGLPMSKNGIILGIATVAAIALIFSIAPREKQRRMQEKAATDASNAPGGAVIVARADGRKRFTGEMQQPETEMTVIDLTSVDAPPDIGAKAAGLERDPKGGLSLRVDFFSPIRCMFGDLNLIEMELSSAPNKQLFLTIEPVNGQTQKFPAIVQPVTIKDIQGGKSHLFPLPDLAEGELIGVYLCSDSPPPAGVAPPVQFSCATKTAVDLNQMSGEFGNKPKPGETPKPSPDKIMFFQFFILQKNSLTFFDTRMKEEAYPQVGQYAATRLESVDKLSAANRALELHRLVRSAPPQTELNVLRLNLPRGDSGQCQKEGIGPPPEIQKKLDLIHSK